MPRLWRRVHNSPRGRSSYRDYKAPCRSVAPARMIVATRRFRRRPNNSPRGRGSYNVTQNLVRRSVAPGANDGGRTAISDFPHDLPQPCSRPTRHRPFILLNIPAPRGLEKARDACAAYGGHPLHTCLIVSGAPWSALELRTGTQLVRTEVKEEQSPGNTRAL